MQRIMRDFTVDIEERLGEAYGDHTKSRMGIDFDAVSEASSRMEASEYGDDKETRMMMRKYNKMANEASKYLNQANLAQLGAQPNKKKR